MENRLIFHHSPTRKIRIVPQKMKDVERISHTQCQKIETDLDIINNIESPLSPAMKTLIEKNIPTTFSSANIEYGSPAFISIGYDQLSAKNKEIAQKFCKIYNNNENIDARIEIPFDDDTDVEVVSKLALLVADQFKLQKDRNVNKYTFAEYLNLYDIKFDDIQGNNIAEKIKSIEKNDGAFYAQEEQKFYLSVQDYIKANYHPIEE